MFLVIYSIQQICRFYVREREEKEKRGVGGVDKYEKHFCLLDGQ